MKQVLKYFGYILILLIICFLIWRFYYIIVWILIAAVLSFTGQPLVRFFDKCHIKKFRIPHSVSAVLSLVVIVLLFLGILAIFVPLIINQAETISKIDVNRLAQNLQGPLQWIDGKLHQFRAIPEGQTIQDFIVTKVKSIVNLGSVGSFPEQFYKCSRKHLCRIIFNTFHSFLFPER